MAKEGEKSSAKLPSVFLSVRGTNCMDSVQKSYGVGLYDTCHSYDMNVVGGGMREE